ncbi:MAG: hypothetical protein A2189_03505 [Paenibacillus sp. RIFOXYA1_FULL_44_5]|nr:MAG: hypothetical protein A2189_03505 [Paenibacillus sp. RIFOXYA1_FULL_44_5]
MDVLKNIQKRRQEKIKSILEQSTEQHPVEYKVEPVLQNHPSEKRHADPRLKDPEFVWNENYANKWERYAHIPDFDELPGINRINGSKGKIWRKMLISLTLFAAVWGVFHIQKPWTAPVKAYITREMNVDFNYGAVVVWYNRYFTGSPAFLPIFHSNNTETQKVNVPPAHTFYAPLKGKIVSPYSEQTHGILLQTAADAPVAATATGRVSFVGQTSDHGLVVMIEHADGWQSIYGLLQSSSVKVDDWVKGGEKIGIDSTQPTQNYAQLYFALKNNNQYLNPMEVVSVD